MSQAIGKKSDFMHVESSLDKKDSITPVKHIEIVLSVFALQSSYISEKEAFDKIQRIVQGYMAQGRSFPLSFTGFKRQISLAIRKNWLERNGMLLRITPQGLEAVYGC